MSVNPEEVAEQLAASVGVQINGPNPWDPQVHDDRFFARVLRDRELGLGESYQEGWWDATSVDQFLTKIMTGGIYKELKLSPGLVRLAALSYIQNRQSVSRAKKNASAHYNMSNSLYSSMLDKRMIYSCGYWDRAANLDEAQEHKLDLICRKLELEAGMHVLEIGCGWGGFAQFVAERYGVRVTGISPAHEQVVVARERCHGLDVEIQELDYRQATGTYDRIVSVGMIEHVGPRNYRAFFDTCDRLLSQDGLMLHHTIANTISTQRGNPWLDKYIFPGGVLPSLAQMASAVEKVFVIEDVHNFGPDYDRTLMSWLANIDAHWSLLSEFDERFRRMWRYYLMSSAASFRSRNTQLYQIVFSRYLVPSQTYRAHR